MSTDTDYLDVHVRRRRLRRRSKLSQFLRMGCGSERRGPELGQELEHLAIQEDLDKVGGGRVWLNLYNFAKPESRRDRSRI